MKTRQAKLQFTPCGPVYPEVSGLKNAEEPLLKVSEIGISYNPAVKSADRLTVTSSTDAERILRKIWCKPLELRECFYALFLNRSNKVLGFFLVSIGGLTGTVADVRTIFQAALKANACSVIFAHNHPSGNLQPSDADIQLTRKLNEAGRIMEVTVLDHIILVPDSYFSMTDNGLL